jgi:hypothetical protein
MDTMAMKKKPTVAKNKSSEMFINGGGDPNTAPPKQKNMVSFTGPKEFHKRIKIEATKADLSMSEMLTKAIEEVVDAKAQVKRLVDALPEDYSDMQKTLVSFKTPDDTHKKLKLAAIETGIHQKDILSAIMFSLIEE